MTNQEKNTLYSVLLRLIDDDNELTPLERRDLMNTVTHACCGMNADDILTQTENNRKLLIKRGTTAQNDEYTGLSGEITLDTDTNTLRIHDGEKIGGYALVGQTTPTVSALSCIPDYANGIHNTMTATEQTYTCPDDGVIVADTTGFNWNQGYIKINGVTMFCVTSNGNSFFNSDGGQYLVAKNDVVTYKSGYINPSITSSTNMLSFYPFRTNTNTSES